MKKWLSQQRNRSKSKNDARSSTPSPTIPPVEAKTAARATTSAASATSCEPTPPPKPTPPVESFEEDVSEGGNFQYEPLPGPDYIRVVTILPAATLNAPVETKIETVHLDKSANYQALSYSWGMNIGGDDTPNRTIKINGKVKPITQNLFEGLLRLRHRLTLPQSTARLRLWIDAVCINQADDLERTQQVDRMRNVYKNAIRTLVWLGEGDNAEDDAAVLKILECVADRISHEGVPQQSQYWIASHGRRIDLSTVLYTRHFDTDLETIRQENSTKADVDNLLEKFLERRWFRRRWVFQELAVSNGFKVEAFWGPYKYRLSRLRYLMFNARLLLHVNSGWLNRWNPLRMLDEALAIPVGKGKEDLLTKLQYCSEMRCSDPRDMLYSLSGLHPEWEILPDYTVNAATTYINFARMLLESGYLQFLLLYKEAKMDPRLPDIALPSWVPDLRGEYRSSGSAYARPYNNDYNVSDDHILTLGLHVIGYVQAVGSWSKGCSQYPQLFSHYVQDIYVTHDLDVPRPLGGTIERRSADTGGQTIEVGDTLCKVPASPEFSHGSGYTACVLRRAGDSETAYELVTAFFVEQRDWPIWRAPEFTFHII